MSIKDACDFLKTDNFLQRLMFPQKTEDAYGIVDMAIRNGYVLCNVEELKTKINDVRDEVLNSNDTYEPNDVLDIIDNILDFLKEACL